MFIWTVQYSYAWFYKNLFNGKFPLKSNAINFLRIFHLKALQSVIITWKEKMKQIHLPLRKIIPFDWIKIISAWARKSDRGVGENSIEILNSILFNRFNYVQRKWISFRIALQSIKKMLKSILLMVWRSHLSMSWCKVWNLSSVTCDMFWLYVIHMLQAHSRTL